MMVRTLLKAYKAASDYLRYRQEILEAAQADADTARAYLIYLRACKASVRRAQERVERIELGIIRRDCNRMAAHQLLGEIAAIYDLKVSQGRDLTDSEAQRMCAVEEVLAGGLM